MSHLDSNYSIMPSMETLSRLFGSENKVKIMRLFLFNPDHVFDIADIARRAKTTTAHVRKEMGTFEKIGLVKRRAMAKKKSKSTGFALDHSFAYMTQLQNFLINIEPLNPKEIIKKISRLGTIRLILVSGVFIQEPESRVDMLIVGDNVKRASLDNTIKTMEAEIGKELKFAYFTTDDFKYRLSMFDKLTRDILDYPHKKVLNRLGNL